MTLKDIARMAGVSVSTVSRVLSDRDTKAASRETREKIWKIIRETGYIPNSNAQQLRGNAPQIHSDGQKRYFAFIYARSQDNKDMFFSELASAIEYEAYKHNLLLKYSFYSRDLDNASFLSAVSSSEISGIVVLGRFSEERMNAIAEAQKNVVYVGLNRSTSKHDTVYCDGYQAGMLAMETLLANGHREIAYLGERNKENRYLGYCNALKAQNLPVDPQRIVETEQSLDGGYRAAQMLIRREVGFSAVFCANDATAIGAVKALQEQGIRVPEDVSVIGIDDIEMTRYFTPMLTTVHIPISELGKQAAKILIDRIQWGHTLPVKIELPFSLARRDSCAENRKGMLRHSH